jgi:mandelate racemase
MVDYNQSLSVAEAIRRVQFLEEEALVWVEEPTRADDFAGHARIAAECRTPIQIGENLWGPHDLTKSLIEHPWFKQSDLEQPNRYSNWYIWTPAGEGVPGSQPFPSEHNCLDPYLPNFFPFQPALNYGYARPDPKEPWQLPITDPACTAVR